MKMKKRTPILSVWLGFSYYGIRQDQFAVAQTPTASSKASTNCGSVRIVSQADADAINACSTITGNVVLATNAATDIHLDTVVVINGSLISEACHYTGPAYDSINETYGYNIVPDPPQYLSSINIWEDYGKQNCSGLLSLSSKNLQTVSQDVSLQNLLNITSVQLPKLTSVGGSTTVGGVPLLEELDLSALSSTSSFRIVYAPLLQNMSTPNIREVTDAIELQSVGLRSLAIFNLTTNLTSLTIGGVPNLSYIPIFPLNVGSIQVQGDGFLQYGTYGDGGALGIRSADTVTVSGCSSVYLGTMAINSVVAIGNSFFELDLSGITGMQSVRVQNNQAVERLVLPLYDSKLATLEVSGNPGIVAFNTILDSGNAQWSPETPQNMISLILTGSPFGYEYITTFTKPGTLYVAGQTVIDSTDPSFNCSSLDPLRTGGYLQGYYSCQGVSNLTAGATPNGVTPRSALYPSSLFIGAVASLYILFIVQ
ncbi:hypothetical protein BX600DRAFT_500659 [Xylariales sp. PMI_506]|nr:hypothetical protein BX600DRAFT_500659 [Xylariales sp. PMI_506]